MTNDVQKLVISLKAIRTELSLISLLRLANVGDQQAMRESLADAWETVGDCDDIILDLRSEAGLTGYRRIDRELQRIHTGHYGAMGTLPYVQLRLRLLHTEASDEQKAQWLTEVSQGVREVCNAIDELIADLEKVNK